ncbi:DUF6529 family protein [Microtetraspora malaysiensis]|uniref:DUF6529 family protein n=1 Tax=Microtetraspora malaysiensis TaxID=161358 RepID=UPI003D8FDABB
MTSPGRLSTPLAPSGTCSTRRATRSKRAECCRSRQPPYARRRAGRCEAPGGRDHTDRARVALHSLAGCFFYGAFAAKVLIVRRRRLPGWALPLAGGTLVILIAILWSSAALWQLCASR